MRDGDSERERDSKKEGKGIKREKAHAVVSPSLETDGALGRHSSQSRVRPFPLICSPYF